MKPIFEYEDYREFLRDRFLELKQTRRSYSFRTFSREAGFSSPNFLKLVIEGQRSLSAQSVPKFAKAFRLNQQETEFFEALVNFNQSKSAEEKSTHFERMTRSRKFRDIRPLEKDQFEYYSKWYYSAVRELVNLPQFEDEPLWISKTLVPKITPKQAKDALALLHRLKLIKRDEKGRCVQMDQTITSGAEVTSLAVIKLHREMMDRASDSLDTISAKERDVSGVTLGVPEAKIGELKAKVAAFRKDLLATVGSTNDDIDRVYQLNIQLFPLSRKRKGKSK